MRSSPLRADRTAKTAHRFSPYSRIDRASPPGRRAASPTSSISASSDDASSDSGSESLGPEWGEVDDGNAEGEEEDVEEKKILIAKPPGEVNRPARGGYNLQTTLSWEKDVYDEVRVSTFLPAGLWLMDFQKHIGALVHSHLNIQLKFSQQDLKPIREAVSFQLCVLFLTLLTQFCRPSWSFPGSISMRSFGWLTTLFDVISSISATPSGSVSAKDLQKPDSKQLRG